MIDDFTSAVFPTQLRQLAFLALIQRAPEDPVDYESSFTVAANGSQLVSKRQTLQFQGASTSARALFRFAGFRVPAPGEMTFRLSVADRTVSEYALKVTRLAS